jgi:hypothetical protein
VFLVYTHEIRRGRDTSLDLKAPNGNVRLRHFSVGQGGVLTIALAETGAMDIAVRESPFSGDIDVSGAVIGQMGPSLSMPLPSESFDPESPPGRFGFQYDDHGALPAVVHSTLRDTLILREISVSGLNFFEERADGAVASSFASQIVSGTLTMTDTGKHLALGSAASGTWPRPPRTSPTAGPRGTVVAHRGAR